MFLLVLMTHVHGFHRSQRGAQLEVVKGVDVSQKVMVTSQYPHEVASSRQHCNLDSSKKSIGRDVPPPPAPAEARAPSDCTVAP